MAAVRGLCALVEPRATIQKTYGVRILVILHKSMLVRHLHEIRIVPSLLETDPPDHRYRKWKGEGDPGRSDAANEKYGRIGDARVWEVCGMSEIGPIGGGASASGVPRPQLEGTGRPGDHADSRSARRGSDRVEVSSLARSMSRQNLEQPVRQELIDRVRAEIEAGRYDTPERIDAAVNRLLHEIDQNA